MNKYQQKVSTQRNTKLVQLGINFLKNAHTHNTSASKILFKNYTARFASYVQKHALHPK